MRVLTVELLFIATAFLVWRDDLTSNFIEHETFVIIWGTAWITAFLFGIAREWLAFIPSNNRRYYSPIPPKRPPRRITVEGEARARELNNLPKKHRLVEMSPAELGLPYGRLTLTEHGFVALMRRLPLKASWEALGGILGLLGVILFWAFSFNSNGWIASSTFTVFVLEVLTPTFAALYALLALPPTQIEFDRNIVTIDRKRLDLEHLLEFKAGQRLAYLYGTQTQEFGGHWNAIQATDLASALNERLRKQKEDYC